jgi:multicomponent Na+:H+ antiporter subunit D
MIDLLWIILTPLVGALLIAATGRSPNVRETVTLLTAVATFLQVAPLTPQVLDGARPALEILPVMPGVPLALQVEPLGMMFALIASFLWIVASLYSIGYMRGNKEHHQTRFYVCFALAIAFTLGIAFSGNLFTLFLFYEALTLSTYPLVTHKGDKASMKAGRVYLGILLSTSIGLLLIGILWTYSITGRLDFVPGGIMEGKIEGPMVGLLLFFYMYGIGKAAMMPIHRWLPAAMVAPTPVSALLHAVAVVKAGVFTVVKVIVYVFGIDLLAKTSSAQWLLYVSGATVIIASLVALQQDNLKRRLAYSTISQLSYVILAAAVLTPISVVGAALHIAAHAFGKITLFFAAGSIYTAAHKTNVSQLDGIGRRMPWTMAAFTIGSLSMIGVPPTAGFLSKWYMLSGAMSAEAWFAVGVLILSTLLNAGYFLPIVYAAFLKPEKLPEHGGHGGHHDGQHSHDHGEAPLPIVIALCITALGTIALFFLPGLPLELAQDLVGGTP